MSNLKTELIVRNTVYNLTEEYVMLANDGLGLPPIHRLEEAGPLQEGASDRGFLVKPRQIKLVLLFSASDQLDYYAKRRRLFQQFRPRLEPSKLRFTLPDGSVRQIDVYYSGELTLPSSEKTGFTHRAAVNLRASDPLFYDPEITLVNFAISVTAQQFDVPMEVPLHIGTPVLDEVSQVPYQGEWACPVTITMIGPATDPIVTNLTSGAKLDFTGLTLDAGDKLIIDTSYGNAAVTDDSGSSLLEFLSDDSDLTSFSLLPDPDALNGVNDIHVQAGNATGQTRIYITYNARYLGV